MMRPRHAIATLLGALALAAAPVHAQEWSIRANVAEVCSCAITCPCNFGSEPTHATCEGNRLIEIEAGRYGDVDLAGVTLLVTFGMREWSKIYVSDAITAEQKEAVDALLPLAFGGFHRTALSIEQAPLRVERSGSRVAFSGPESRVEMEPMKGRNGEAVKVLNLPSPVFIDYTQYVSVTHEHASADKRFSHSGTTGFTSRMEVEGPRH